MFVMRTNGRSFDTEFPVEDNPDKIVSINKTGLLVDHGDSEGSMMFYPWSSIDFIATNIEAEKQKLGGL